MYRHLTLDGFMDVWMVFMVCVRGLCLWFVFMDCVYVVCMDIGS